MRTNHLVFSENDMSNFTFLHQPRLSEDPLEETYFVKVQQLIDSWLSGEEIFTIQSSGSTGAPKKIALHRNQMIYSASTTGKALQLPAGTKALIVLNAEMIAGLMMLVRTMELNWEATIMRPTSDPLQEIPEELIFDFTALTPIQLSTLLSKYPKEVIGRKFKKILLGGAPIDAFLINQIADIRTAVYQSYGMTETVSHVALRKINGDNSSEDYELLDDIEAGTDERGCLHISGTVTGNQKIQTNDLVELTGKRTFRWIGRSDNIINSGGIKIQLDKVDRAVSAVLAIMQINPSFFSWSIPDQLLGQKLVLIIQEKHSDKLTEMLLEQLHTSLTKYEIPKEILYLKDFIKTPSGKTDKAATVNSYLRSH